MAHNKGKYYRQCPECNRKRYCKFLPWPNDHRKVICSKGHEWIIKLAYLERINNIIKKQLESRLKNLFDRDDTFYKNIKKR